MTNMGLFGQSPYAGLLSTEQQQSLQSQQLMGLAQGLLAASGPSPVPIGLGQAFGAGLQNAQQAGNNNLAQLVQLAQLKKAFQREPVKLGAGETLYDPDTGQVVLEGKPEQPKPPTDYRYNASGGLEIIPGSPTAEKQSSAAELAQTAINNIDRMLDPKNRWALKHAVGPVSSRLPTVWGPTADFEKRLEQIQGQTFLQAYAQLKGGGQITEIEGAKAEAALNRMKSANSERGFIEAANEFRAILAKAVQKAGGSVPNQSYAPQGPNITAPKFLGFE